MEQLSFLTVATTEARTVSGAPPAWLIHYSASLRFCQPASKAIGYAKTRLIEHAFCVPC